MRSSLSSTNIQFSLDNQMSTLLEKERKTIDKLRRRQKNEIENEIEHKLRSEIIKIKSNQKDELVKILENKRKKELLERAKIEDKKQKVDWNSSRTTSRSSKWYFTPLISG